ncbi:NUDIX domain-containing protein [Cryptosporangium phraense]|uniref:NUDIX domain-containing protein n=1 Tax=Cryptosporangium phraense TaxID=2593070 RepID=UPI00197AF7B1|nr:NUDIX hydrolase [Cryptosporangium phraense]
MAFDYTTIPTKRSAAGILFTRDTTRDHGELLLVEPTYKPDWEIPGGAVERDESPRAAARRETHEELGLTVEPGRLLVVDWSPARGARTEGFMFIFDGPDLDPDQIRLQPEELRSLAWCTPDESDTRTAPPLARRIRSALVARKTGETLYLEDGNPTLG